MKKVIINIFLLIFCVSCIIEEPGPVETPVARVNNNYLYKNDLKKLFGQSVSPQDSIYIVKSYIDNWVKEQLMLSKAELNLTEEEKDVQEKLNNYRNSLLIFKYQERYIRQKLDTIITFNEVQEYYDENTQNFLLDKNLVKALYIKISKDIPANDLYQMVRWLRYSIEEDKQKLYNFCMQYAENFDNFNNNWVVFNLLQLQFPYKIYKPESTLRWKKYFQAKDTAYNYYLKINDFVPKSETAPLEYIEGNIRSIIINKRKITLIKQLEKEVYNDALNRDLIKIY